MPAENVRPTRYLESRDDLASAVLDVHDVQSGGVRVAELVRAAGLVAHLEVE